MSNGFARLSLLTALALGACTKDGGSPTPYDVGLTWTLTEQVTATTKSMRAVGSAGAVESKGATGGAESCSDARDSSGALTVIETERREVTSEVVGNTVSHHPLIPGNDGFSAVGVSIVAEHTLETGRAETTESFFVPDSDDDRWTERDVNEYADNGSGRYHGVASDEYIVSLFPLDLWSLNDNPWDQAWDEETDFPRADEEPQGHQTFSLLSRHNPAPGDLWTSLNGNMVYRYAGKEKINVGGKSVNADKIEVFTVSDYDAVAGAVITDCLVEGTVETFSDFPDVDDVLTSQVDVLPGCTDRFMHQEVGTQWWYGDALVQFEGRRVFVEINDAGYEWYEDEDDYCLRYTSDVKPTDTTTELFVEYTVTEEITSSSVSAWDVVKPGKE